MDNMRIGGGLGIFKKIAATKTENTVSNNSFSTNPFGLSFKGKIHSGDLFQKAGQSSDALKNSISEKGKMVVSAVVGSLTHIQDTFKQTIDKAFGPIIVFAKKTGTKIANITEKVSNFKASDLRISNLIKPDLYPKNISGTTKQLHEKYKNNVDGLEALWQSHLAQA